MKKEKLRNIAKFIFLALLLFSVVYITYLRPEEPETQVVEREPTFSSGKPETTLRDSLVEYGMEFLGTPYITAGNGVEGFDCSGYVYFVFQHFDIEVPRSTSNYENFGEEIPLESVEKGDLLLFLSPTRNAIGHIGIVSDAKGADSEFVHASSGNSMKVIITSLANETYTRRFVKAIRIL